MKSYHKKIKKTFSVFVSLVYLECYGMEDPSLLREESTPYLLVGLRGLKERPDFPSQALSHLDGACDGNQDDQFQVAVHFMRNKFSMDTAINLLLHVGRKKHADALNWLGALYSGELKESRFSEKDLERAGDCYAKAAELGNIAALFNMAVFYEQGYGRCQKGLEIAKMFYWQAAQKGHEGAKRRLQDLDALEDLEALADSSNTRKLPFFRAFPEKKREKKEVPPKRRKPNPRHEF